MTANELFLRHATKSLGQYQGNLRWFCEAVEGGHVPSANDDLILPHVQRLKQHMGVRTASDEDEFLLRFGLIVPGLARGIRPPVSVLNVERGGFSDKRLEQAAAQVSRLQAALRLGRRYLVGLSSSPVTALRELAERIRVVAAEDNTWVEIHARLPEVEAQALARRAFSCLDESPEASDLGESILCCLANFRFDGLGQQICGALERRLFWPPSIYRDAPDDVAKSLVRLIEDTDGLQLNHLLLALAWTRGEVARCAFLKWRQETPEWAKELCIPPEDYSHNGGWALDANGKHVDLVSVRCHRLAPCSIVTSAGFAVPCRTEVKERCPACGGSLAWLFDFTNLPDEFFVGEWTSAPKRILCCLHCSCFCPAVFSRYQPDGTAELHPAIASEETSNFGVLPPSIRELVVTPQPPFAAAEAFGIDDTTSFGGAPMWLQDSQFPHCPDCQNVMRFLAQFDNGSMPKPEEGIYYAFFCPDCRVAAVNFQQT